MSVVSPCRCIARGFPHICDASASRGAPHTLGAKVRCSGDIVRTLASYCSLIFAAVAGGERIAHWAGLAQFLRKETCADSAPSFGADLDTKNQSGIVKTYNEFENIHDFFKKNSHVRSSDSGPKTVLGKWALFANVILKPYIDLKL